MSKLTAYNKFLQNFSAKIARPPLVNRQKGGRDVRNQFARQLKYFALFFVMFYSWKLNELHIHGRVFLLLH
jgi:hypothetical protein